MIAEFVANAGQKLLGTTPPNGKDYWASRFWDRASAEKHPLLAEDFRMQKDEIAAYLEQYGGQARRSIEFACGTGDFTWMTAELTPVKEIVALDVSTQGLDMTREKVKHENLELVCGDFWKDYPIGKADLVLCIDAIHHLGDVGEVLYRLKSFVEPGGILLGNVVTRDNFHEFGRKRYGPVRHAVHTSSFLGTAMMIRFSGGKLNTGSYRTQLRPAEDVQRLLRINFREVLATRVDPYFMSFAVRV